MISLRYFVWTRYGTEAGEPIEEILRRKEAERVANNGIFLWGIGNALGPSIQALKKRVADPCVVFSPIKTPPRAIDVRPSKVVSWTTGELIDGTAYRLPVHSIVTSREKRAHYALVCFSTQKLCFEAATETVEFGTLRNLVSGRPLGRQQVTAVVERCMTSCGDTYAYPATIVSLYPPYYVKLTS
jgi:hypothetical protein